MGADDPARAGDLPSVPGPVNVYFAGGYFYKRREELFVQRPPSRRLVTYADKGDIIATVAFWQGRVAGTEPPPPPPAAPRKGTRA